MLKVIGLGNSLRGDDGIGPEIIRVLKQSPQNNIQPIEIAADAFSLLEHLMGERKLVIIDCAKMGQKPGSVKSFKLDDSMIAAIENSFSLHSAGFGEVYALAKKMGPVAPCLMIGVEPKRVDFNCSLSEEVKESIPLTIKIIQQEAIRDA